MRKLIFCLMLVSGIASADNEMAYTSNKAGGNIFFTFSNCVYLSNGQRIPDNYYVYSTDSAGNKIADGCYSYKYPFYFVTWNSGGRLSVNINSVTAFYNK
jgi:hypothetical protein